MCFSKYIITQSTISQASKVAADAYGESVRPDNQMPPAPPRHSHMGT